MMEEMLISMLGKMTGLTPEEMQALSNKAMGLLNTIATDMEEIKTRVKNIEAQLSQDKMYVENLD